MLLTGTVLTGMLTAHALSAARASDGIPSPLASGGIPSSAETIAPVEPPEKGEQVSEEKLPNGMTFIYRICLPGFSLSGRPKSRRNDGFSRS